MEYTDEVDDSVMQNRGYEEFRLDKIDEDNLYDIENCLKNGKINSENKMDILTYLNTLFRKMSDIRKRENILVPEDNENVHDYLDRISKLRFQIEQIK